MELVEKSLRFQNILQEKYEVSLYNIPEGLVKDWDSN